MRVSILQSLVQVIIRRRTPIERTKVKKTKKMKNIKKRTTIAVLTRRGSETYRVQNH